MARYRLDAPDDPRPKHLLRSCRPSRRFFCCCSRASINQQLSSVRGLLDSEDVLWLTSLSRSYNQYTYAYYALDSYAQEMAAPPNGCVVSAEQVFETAEPVTDLPTATAGAPEVGAAGACHTHAGGM